MLQKYFNVILLEWNYTGNKMTQVYTATSVTWLSFGGCGEFQSSHSNKLLCSLWNIVSSKHHGEILKLLNRQHVKSKPNAPLLQVKTYKPTNMKKRPACIKPKENNWWQLRLIASSRTFIFSKNVQISQR